MYFKTNLLSYLVRNIFILIQRFNFYTIKIQLFLRVFYLSKVKRGALYSMSLLFLFSCAKKVSKIEHNSDFNPLSLPYSFEFSDGTRARIVFKETPKVSSGDEDDQGEALEIFFSKLVENIEVEVASLKPGSETPVIFWMNDSGMNHGTAPVNIEVKGHSWLVKNIYFIMPGRWELRLSARLPNGKLENSIFKIDVK